MIKVDTENLSETKGQFNLKRVVGHKTKRGKVDGKGWKIYKKLTGIAKLQNLNCFKQNLSR